MSSLFLVRKNYMNHSFMYVSFVIGCFLKLYVKSNISVLISFFSKGKHLTRSCYVNFSRHSMFINMCAVAKQ
jgi:hypothetical protein